MPRHLRIEFPGAIYHVTVRGNGRQSIFLDDRDRERFLDRLARSVESYEVRLYLYCLMTNHYHLLVEIPKANISRFMQSLETGYTVYFNLRHGRSGHLTQGRFGGKLVEGDEYLLALARYLHLNPVRTTRLKHATAKEKREVLRAYRWSSYRSYVGLGKEVQFLEHGPLLDLTGGRSKKNQRRTYRRFVEAGLAMNDEYLQELLSESPRAIGSEQFLRWVDGLYQEQLKKSEKPEDVSFRRVLVDLGAEEILAVVCEQLEVSMDDLQLTRRGSFEKAIAAQMLWKYGRLSKRGVAQELGLGSGTAVGWQLKKLEKELSVQGGGRRDLDLGKKVAGITERLETTRRERLSW